MQTLKTTQTWHQKLTDNGHIMDWTAVFLKFRMFSTGWYLYYKAIKLFPDSLHCEQCLAGTHSPAALWAPGALINSWRRIKVQMSQCKLIKATFFWKKLLAAYEANISFSVWRPFCRQSIFHYLLASFCDPVRLQKRSGAMQSIISEAQTEKLCVLESHEVALFLSHYNVVLEGLSSGSMQN